MLLYKKLLLMTFGTTRVFSVTFFTESRAVYKAVREKYGRAGQATNDNIIRHRIQSDWPRQGNTHNW